MALFSLIAKLGLDKTGFDAGMSAAGRTAGRFSSQLKAQLAAAFSIAAITAYTRSLVDYASKVKDASVRTGASIEAIQTLGHAAKLTGADFDTVVRSFKDLSKARQEALDKPESKAAQVFKALGIDGQKLKDLKLEDLFREIGRSFEAQDFGASELAMVTELLGRAGGELLPMFKQGMDELEEGARKAGVALRDDIINQFDEIGDQIDTLIAQLRGPFAEALGGILKLLNATVGRIEAGFKSVSSFTTGFVAAVEARKNEPEKQESVVRRLFRAPGRAFEALAAGVQGGVEQVKADALGDLIQGIIGKALGGAVDAILPKVVPKDERKRRQFNFEEAIKERQPVDRLVRPQPDALGRIGGTIGGGESTTERHVRDMVREVKELRRTIEVRGIRITGEL